MIRYPAFDPPEYVNWRREDDVVAEYHRVIERDPERAAIISSLDAGQLLAMYEGLLRQRLHDIALKRWVKQGVASKAWLGTGEEATTIGPIHAIHRGPAEGHDMVSPMIRNAGACHEMGMPVSAMLCGYLGTQDSPTGGRDLHIGDFYGGTIAAVSPIGVTIPVAAGVALGLKLRHEPSIVLAWIGDGATKSGPFHEGMNFAASQRLPMVVIIQNNQVALGTRLEQYHRGSFEDWPEAYGVKGWSFDGNNVLDAYAAVKIAAEMAREPDAGPFLLSAETFRMSGHATHDEREARETFPDELFKYWGKRDPIAMYETYLVEGYLDLKTGSRQASSEDQRQQNRSVLAELEERIIAQVDAAAEEALESMRHRMPVPETAATGVYASDGGPSAAAAAAAGAVVVTAVAD